MIPAQVILKTDARGRVRVPVERREALLDEYEKSGLSAKKFALLVGMKHQTFATWATKRGKQRGMICSQGSQVQRPAEAVPKLQWVEAVIEKDARPMKRRYRGERLPISARWLEKYLTNQSTF